MDIEKSKLDNAIKTLQEKAGPRPCPFCGKLAGFYFDEHEFQELSFNRTPAGIQTTGHHSYISCLVGSCKNCGYILKFSLSELLGDPSFLNK